MSIIFNLTTKCSIIPDVWKNSYVFPIFKKGNREYIVNHKPVKIIVDSQHVFEPGKSTITNDHGRWNL